MFHYLPAEKCPTCGATIPPQLRAVVELAIRRDPPRKPALLVIGMVGSAFFCGVSMIFLALAPFDIGSYTINDKPVSGPEFLRRAGFLFFGGAAVCGVISYGLARDRGWTRLLMLVYWVVIAVGSLGLSDGGSIARSILTSLFALAIAVLYLYAKDSVTDYYDAVIQREKDEASFAAKAG